MQKPLACEFIAYAFAPSQICYLLPTLTLQRAWRMHGVKWTESYGEVRAKNRGYVTVSVAVPTAELLQSMGDAMRVRWGSV